MIRSKIVELSSLEGIAYREKTEEGFLITVRRLSDGLTASAVLEKKTMGLCPVGKVDETVFSPWVFEEAMTRTAGLPYLERALPNVGPGPQTKEAPNPILSSREYWIFLRAYQNDAGRIDFALLKGDLARQGKETPLAALGSVLEEITGRTPEPQALEAFAALLEDASLTPLFFGA